jgi:hypothetical protein
LAGVSTSTNGIVPIISHGYVQYYNPTLVDDQFTYTVTNQLGMPTTATVTLRAAAAQIQSGQINTLNLSGGRATLRFGGIPNYLYHVQVSTNLTDWTTLWDTNAPAGGRFQFTDPSPPQPSAFYRLIWSGN